MKNKYFTPDIEDFHVGYEYEYEDIIPSGASDYFKSIISKPSEIENLFKGFDTGMGIRVPYLTKEQIEAEGWEYEKEIKTVQCYDKENIFIAYSEKTHRMLIRKHNNETWKTIYFGRCKDVNTFKKIIKLLEI